MKIISFKLIFRSWRRNKVFTVISLLSLAIGIACTNLLTAYVIHEFTIEASNPEKDRIVYMAQDSPMTSGEKVSYIVGDIPVSLTQDYPEIEDHLRLNVEESRYTLVNGNRFAPLTLVTADPSFPRFFPYKVLYGNLEEALSEPHKIALTESCARRLFGWESPLGQTIVLRPPYDEPAGNEGGNSPEASGNSPSDNPQGDSHVNTDGPDTGKSGGRQKTADISRYPAYQVVAVLEDRPQSFLSFDGLTANTLPFHGGVSLLRTTPAFDAEAFARKIRDDGVPTLQNDLGRYYFYSLQESYFQSYPQESISYIPRNNKTLVYAGLASALLILLIACFNYVNLSFSRLLQQVRMIHIQQCMGASRADINRQVFADTFLTVIASFLLSLLITHDLLPLFNRIVSGRMEASFFFSGQVLPVIGSFILLFSLVPAGYMSRRIAGLSQSGYRTFFTGNKKQRIVTALTVAQFGISIGLLFATFVVRGQLNLIRQGGEGYRGLIEIGEWNGRYRSSMELFARELRRYPEIGEITLTKGSILFFGLRQLVIRDDDGHEQYYSLGQFGGDTTLLHTLRLPVLQGLSPTRALAAYHSPVYINRQYARIMIPPGENPVGKPLRLYDSDFAQMEKAEETPTVIAGIVENLYTQTMEKEVIPALTYLFDQGPYDYILIRLPGKDRQKAIDRVREVAAQIYPDEYLTYEDVYATYLSYNRKTLEFAGLLLMYSLISLLLTASGLFGMALYAIEQRTKEIGIRKVNGATTFEIMYLLTRRFIGWVAIAWAVAIPVTWYILTEWLAHFAYRTHITFGIALTSGLLVAAVTLLTVSWHSYRAASTDPVRVLRRE